MHNYWTVVNFQSPKQNPNMEYRLKHLMFGVQLMILRLFGVGVGVVVVSGS